MNGIHERKCFLEIVVMADVYGVVSIRSNLFHVIVADTYGVVSIWSGQYMEWSVHVMVSTLSDQYME